MREMAVFCNNYKGELLEFCWMRHCFDVKSLIQKVFVPNVFAIYSNIIAFSSNAFIYSILQPVFCFCITLSLLFFNKKREIEKEKQVKVVVEASNRFSNWLNFVPTQKTPFQHFCWMTYSDYFYKKQSFTFFQLLIQQSNTRNSHPFFFYVNSGETSHG